jgi:hypothetical protein
VYNDHGNDAARSIQATAQSPLADQHGQVLGAKVTRQWSPSLRLRRLQQADCCGRTGCATASPPPAVGVIEQPRRGGKQEEASDGQDRDGDCHSGSAIANARHADEQQRPAGRCWRRTPRKPGWSMSRS